MAGKQNPGLVNFTAPAKYVDGTTIPANQVTRFEYGFAQTAQGAKPQASKVYPTIIPDTDFTADSQGKQFGPVPGTLALGSWFCAQRTVTKDGAVSDWSNEAPFDVVPKQPEPVTDFAVQ